MSSKSHRNMLQRSWRLANTLTFILWPLSLIYQAVFAIRSVLYRFKLFSSYRAPVPVIVVGNITVGGTGKTPMVIYLVEQLRKLGFTPGVISRGYGGISDVYPLMVTESVSASVSGDEPALIVRRIDVPMVVGPNRRADIELLLNETKVDIIISDDGLQHLALERDVEICILDKTSLQHNYFRLPAGPYRESVERLKTVDFVVQHIKETNQTNKGFEMYLSAQKPIPLLRTNKLKFDASNGLHAVAGIGNPQRFFDTCTQYGWDIREHAFADHHSFTKSDIEFADDLPVLMTEKDAVKCKQFASDKHWFLPVDAKISKQFIAALELLLKP